MSLDQFPISSDEARTTLARIAKQIHYRYRSPFALVLVLPNAIWAGKVLEEELEKDGAHPITSGIGMVLAEIEGQTRAMVVEPPSHHAIKGKKVVLFDAQGDFHITSAAGRFLVNMKPQSIEVAALFVKGETPQWVNPDYVGYNIDENILVTGLGLGYNQDQASGGAITAIEVPQDAPPADTSEEATGGEADGNSSRSIDPQSSPATSECLPTQPCGVQD